MMLRKNLWRWSLDVAIVGIGKMKEMTVLEGMAMQSVRELSLAIRLHVTAWGRFGAQFAENSFACDQWVTTVCERFCTTWMPDAFSILFALTWHLAWSEHQFKRGCPFVDWFHDSDFGLLIFVRAFRSQELSSLRGSWHSGLVATQFLHVFLIRILHLGMMCACLRSGQNLRAVSKSQMHEQTRLEGSS